MGVGVREAGVCVSVSWGAVMWLDVLCTVLFTVVMFVGGGGMGIVRSICSVFTLCTAFVDCEEFLFTVCTGGCLALFTTG